MYGISPEQYAEYEASIHPLDPTRGPTKAPARKRRFRRSVSVPVAIAIGIVMTMLGSGAAIAATGFSDVPDNHQFADEISWMNSTGISEGYPDGTYRPNAPVSRGAMSAFMQRLYDLQDDMSHTTIAVPQTFDTTSWVDATGMAVAVVVPAGTWANIAARYNAESYVVGGNGLWGSVRLVVSKNGGPFTEMLPNSGTNLAFDTASTGQDQYEAHGIERVTEVSSGTYTIKVQVTVQAGATMQLDDMTLVAETDLQPSWFIPS